MHPAQEEEKQLLYEVGACLAQWSSVENFLVQLFCELHDRSDGHGSPLREAFESVISLEVRLAMLDATVNVDRRNEQAFRDRWNAIYNKVKKLVRKRNQLAHFSLFQALLPNGTYAPRIQPFASQLGYTLGTAPAPLSASQLCARREAFHRLAVNLSRLVAYISAVRGRYGGDPKQLGDPARLLRDPNAPTPIET